MKVKQRLRMAALLAVFFAGAANAEPRVEDAVQTLEDEWAEAFYRQPADRQVETYKALLPRIKAVEEKYPGRAEPMILEAAVLCTYAAADWGFSSLTRINQARDLLVKSIDLDPKAMDAGAFITLGNLYYRLPGWPFSFGDNELALQYLENANKLYPDSLDSNYFLGDYWLHEGDYDRALVYLEKADKAPIRQRQFLSDSKLKEELRVALSAARERHKLHADFFSSLLPSSYEEKDKPVQ